MHRYLPGILLVQIVTLAIFWVNLDATGQTLWLQAGFPSALIAVVTALWLASIGRADAERASVKLRLDHARDREKLQLDAERSKAKVLERSFKEMRKQERRVSRRANVKVGLAFIGVTAAGVLLLITELFTLGLMTITTASGAMGGYLLRMRQSRIDSSHRASHADLPPAGLSKAGSAKPSAEPIAASPKALPAPSKLPEF